MFAKTLDPANISAQLASGSFEGTEHRELMRNVSIGMLASLDVLSASRALVAARIVEG
jgi:hypothetical protein